MVQAAEIITVTLAAEEGSRMARIGSQIASDSVVSYTAAIIPTAVVSVIALVVIILTIKTLTRTWVNTSQKVTLSSILAIVLVALFCGWWLTLGRMQANGIQCGSAFPQWLYNVFGAESNFDDPAQISACALAGLRQTLIGLALCLVSLVLWYVSWSRVRKTGTPPRANR